MKLIEIHFYAKLCILATFFFFFNESLYLYIIIWRLNSELAEGFAWLSIIVGSFWWSYLVNYYVVNLALVMFAIHFGYMLVLVFLMQAKDEFGLH